MSTWATKVEEIKCAKSATFCVSHNQWIAGSLNILPQLDDCGSGLVCIEREWVEDALKELETAEMSEDERGENGDILEAILEDMGKDDYVEYLCG